MNQATELDVAERIVFDAGGGLRLSVARSGSGPALMLLHGFTGSAVTWEPLTASLSSQHTVLSVDLPGHGQSSAPVSSTRYSLDLLAGDLARLLDSLGVERVATLGYSLGGRAALRFALRHPSRVSALVLESSSPGIADPAERDGRLVSDEALAGMIERDGIDSFVNFWEGLPIWASQSSLTEEVRAALRTERMHNSAIGLANSLRGAGAAADASVAGLLSPHLTPTLIVVGELDARYVAVGRLMASSMKRARLEIVRNAGHAVHLEQRSSFAKAVVEFLAEVPSAGGTWL